jgi:hypothetical protein
MKMIKFICNCSTFLKLSLLSYIKKAAILLRDEAQPTSFPLYSPSYAPANALIAAFCTNFTIFSDVTYSLTPAAVIAGLTISKAPLYSHPNSISATPRASLSSIRPTAAEEHHWTVAEIGQLALWCVIAGIN